MILFFLIAVLIIHTIVPYTYTVTYPIHKTAIIFYFLRIISTIQPILVSNGVVSTADLQFDPLRKIIFINRTKSSNFI